MEDEGGMTGALGGVGFGLLELGVVFQEAGRAALGAPLLSPVLAAELLARAAESAAAGRELPAGLLDEIGLQSLLSQRVTWPGKQPASSRSPEPVRRPRR